MVCWVLLFSIIIVLVLILGFLSPLLLLPSSMAYASMDNEHGLTVEVFCCKFALFLTIVLLVFILHFCIFYWFFMGLFAFLLPLLMAYASMDNGHGLTIEVFSISLLLFSP